MNENVYFATSYNRKDGRTRVIVMEKSLLSVMDFVTGDEYGWVEEDSASHAILWSVSLGATCLHFTGIIGVFSLASKGFIPYEVLGKGQDAKLCFDDLAVPLHHGVVAPLSDASYVKVNYHLEWWNVLHDAKIRVVTVHGFNGSPKNKAYREINRILPNAEVIGLEYEDWLDSSGIEKTLEALAPDLIIGNSLGGFYTLCYKGECRRIVINPCLQPSVEIPK
ncbi:MAG: hypothetical protein KBS81_04995, partial [Spirochaetales bacterium]|nr:hypothetical protein [Candidatus Physcosoma equi]